MKTTNERITAKDLAIYLNVSRRTSRKYLKDIKEHYNIKIVLQSHLLDYFGVENVPVDSEFLEKTK